MMLRIKNSKIEDLMTENEMKQIGLICSEQMLQEDTRSFLDFFAEIKETTAKASQDLERLKKERNEATHELRLIEDECAAINSKMTQNLEMLGVLQTYKVFLDKLKQTDSSFNDAQDDKEKKTTG